MEKIVARVEEDIGQLSKEGLKMAANDLLLLLVDESEDDLTGAVGIGPLLHADGVLNLHLAQLEQILLALGVVKLDRVGDLAVQEHLRVLLLFDELLEVVVQCVSKSSVLTLAVELLAEVEQLRSDLVVDVEQLRVLTERVQNDLGD